MESNQITGNIGEWSEIYTLLKLLGEGRVYAGDQNLEKIKDLFYPIIMILRHENSENLKYKVAEKDVVIVNDLGVELLRVPADVFLTESETLLAELQNHQKGTGSFSVPATQRFMERIHCHTLKAKSADKTDIRIVLHDQRTKLNSEMGFSIKSQIGARSTLLNPGKTTNFKFYVKGFEMSQEEVDRINAISTKSKLMDRVNAIYDTNCRLVFDKVVCDTFNYNLQMLDGTLARIVADALVIANRFGLRNFSDLSDILVDENPLDLVVPATKTTTEKDALAALYQYKLKHFLTTIALGMTPGTLWNGIYDANGGYLVVKSDGEVLCYHFYDRNRFQDFLFANASLDNPSTTRYEYGSLYYDDCGILSFNLNLQIRLK